MKLLVNGNHTGQVRLLTTLSFCALLTACSSTEQAANTSEPATNNKQQVEIPIHSYDEALAQANKAVLQGDWESALFAYVRSLEFKPNQSNTYLEIARIHKRLNNQDLAIKAYEQAIAITPNIIEAQQEIGVFHLNQRNYQKAKNHLIRAINEDQSALSANGAAKDGDLFILEKRSPIAAYTAYAVILDMEKQFEQSRAYYQAALTAQPRSHTILSNLGYSYYLNGEYRKAENYYKRAIRIKPGFRRAWTNLGLVYVREQDYDRAVKTLKQVMPEFEAYNDVGYFLMLEGRLIEAEYFFNKAIESSPRYFKKAYVNLEQISILKKEHEQSLEKLPAFAPAQEEVAGKQ